MREILHKGKQMREILYRGKRIDNGKWVEGYPFRIWERAYILWGTTNDVPNMIEVDPETVCQSTGLSDKNGSEIFEGDIVKQFADCSESGKDLYYFYKIRWNEEYCAFEGFEIYTKETFLFSDLQDIEVIGNIFDNPKLLEVENE